MWNVCKITEGLYYFTDNSINYEEPVAIVHIKVVNNQLAMQIDVCMSYLTRMEEFDELLNELRYFARVLKQQRDKEGCFMNIHCQGISCFDGESPFPPIQESKGLLLIDTTFYEEII